MQIAEIVDYTEVEGPFLRSSVWLQGCSINCVGCCNQEFIPQKGGFSITPYNLYQRISKNNVEGITVLGGEPLDQSKELYDFLKLIKDNTELGIMLFTGHKYEKIVKKDDMYKVIQLCDLVISEPFIKKMISNERRWIGSSNQKVHFITDRYSYLKDNWEPYYKEIEFHIKDGEIIINGMPFESGIL